MHMTNQLPDENSAQFKQFIAIQPTAPISTVTPFPKTILKRRNLLALALLALFVIVLFVVWHTLSQPAPTSTLSPHTFTTIIPTSTPMSNTTNLTTTEIQVYIVGAIKHPGVYTLPATARAYQLVQAAGGPLSNANLLTINLAAKLSDGQEVYVSAIGETSSIPSGTSPTNPTNPTNPTTPTTSTNSNLLNINTATITDLRQNLHLSQTSAQNIVTYRLEHGNFTSIDQLLQVISKSIYNRIKTQITIS
jgi:competence protein ComEA